MEQLKQFIIRNFEKILVSRILVNAFDAITSDRPYRKGIPPWEALEEILKNAGKQFDPRVVEPFRRAIHEKMEKV